jgi:hypothetical protein
VHFKDASIGIPLTDQVDELLDRALGHATQGQEQRQSQPPWAAENPGEAPQCCHVCGVNGLQHQSRSPARALGELIAHVHDLRLEGRAWKVT